MKHAFMDSFLRTVGMVVVVAAIIIALAALYAFPVKWLWNWLMPTLFHLGRIDVFQAWGILALSSFLFNRTTAAKKSDA